ncbi:unnamed protein product [Effrenium voratum]|uniref:ribose-phosphate diphosphokinase n=1 Tax=Effrenium voratum TaxID=2562239 RepID=A0AA36HT46_9DINO|nr:unnamed protein product [Effrenium voratum]
MWGTELLVQSHMLADLEGFLGEQVLVCSLAVMEEATGVSVPSKAASLCFARAARLPPSLPSGDLRRVVVLDGLTDATNVGSIARVARALGATALLLSRDCCDALAPLAVRASQGQIFHLPFFQGDLVPLLKELREEGVLTLAAVVQEGAKYLDEVKALPERWALVLGSEHFGVSLEVREVCCGMLKVRMAPGVDSFNAAGLKCQDDDRLAAKLAARYAAAASLAYRSNCTEMEEIVLGKASPGADPKSAPRKVTPARIKPVSRDLPKESGSFVPPRTATPSQAAKEVFLGKQMAAQRLSERTEGSSRPRLRGLSRSPRREPPPRRQLRSKSPSREEKTSPKPSHGYAPAALPPKTEGEGEGEKSSESLPRWTPDDDMVPPTTLETSAGRRANSAVAAAISAAASAVWAAAEKDEGEDSVQAIRIPLGHPPVLFGLPGSEQFLKGVLSHLRWRSGECSFQIFDNGEISPKVLQTVANHDVYVIVVRNDMEAEMNFNLMRLLLLVSALKGESPHRLTVVMPCLDYARQDRKLVAGEAIAPKLLLRCMKTAGATRCVTVDLHNQAEAAFSPPGMVLDELSSDQYLANFIRQNVACFDEERTLVCATNGGGMKFTRRMADLLRVGFVMADRFRQQGGGQGDVKIISEHSQIHGVTDVVVIDDMFDTCGNLVEVCTALCKLLPAAKIYGVAPHGYFSGDAGDKVTRLVKECNLQWLAVTNSMDQTAGLKRMAGVGQVDRIKVIDISKLLAGAIARLHLAAPVNVPNFRGLGPQDPDPVLAGYHDGGGKHAELRKRISSF